MDKNFISVDDLVRQRLGGVEEEERGGAWLNMRDLLDKEMPQQKRRIGILYWRRLFGLVAIVSLVGTVAVGGYEVYSASKSNSNTVIADASLSGSEETNREYTIAVPTNEAEQEMATASNLTVRGGMHAAESTAASNTRIVPQAAPIATNVNSAHGGNNTNETVTYNTVTVEGTRKESTNSVGTPNNSATNGNAGEQATAIDNHKNNSDNYTTTSTKTNKNNKANRGNTNAVVTNKNRAASAATITGKAPARIESGAKAGTVAATSAGNKVTPLAGEAKGVAGVTTKTAAKNNATTGLAANAATSDNNSTTASKNNTANSVAGETKGTSTSGSLATNDKGTAGDNSTSSNKVANNSSATNGSSANGTGANGTVASKGTGTAAGNKTANGTADAGVVGTKRTNLNKLPTTGNGIAATVSATNAANTTINGGIGNTNDNAPEIDKQDIGALNSGSTGMPTSKPTGTAPTATNTGSIKATNGSDLTKGTVLNTGANKTTAAAGTTANKNSANSTKTAVVNANKTTATAGTTANKNSANSTKTAVVSANKTATSATGKTTAPTATNNKVAATTKTVNKQKSGLTDASANKAAQKATTGNGLASNTADDSEVDNSGVIDENETAENETSVGEEGKKITKIVVHERQVKNDNNEISYRLDTISMEQLNKGGNNAGADDNDIDAIATNTASRKPTINEPAAMPTTTRTAHKGGRKNNGRHAAIVAEEETNPAASGYAGEEGRNESEETSASIAPAATVSSSSTDEAVTAATDEAASAEVKKEAAAKKHRGASLLKKMSLAFNNVKQNAAGATFTTGITAGINSNFFGPSSFKGFQFGMTGNLAFNETWNMMAELKYFNRINGNNSIDDSYYTYTQVGSGNFRKDKVLNTYDFSAVHSIEMPVTIRYAKGKFNFFTGANFLYAFSINTGAATRPDPNATPEFVNQQGTDNTPKLSDADFRSRFGLGYIFGFSYQVGTNTSIDLRNVQTVWDNAATTGAKSVSGQLYKTPSLQLSIMYRLGGNRNKD